MCVHLGGGGGIVVGATLLPVSSLVIEIIS